MFSFTLVGSPPALLISATLWPYEVSKSIVLPVLCASTYMPLSPLPYKLFGSYYIITATLKDNSLFLVTNYIVKGHGRVVT